jgi:TP901 family phage tail tape measure protein
MNEDLISIGMKVDETLGAGFNKVLKFFTEYGIAVEQAGRASVQFDKAGDLLSASLSNVQVAGVKVNLTLKQTEKGLRLVTIGASETKRALSSLAEEQARLKDLQLGRQAKREAKSVGSSLQKGVDLSSSTPEEAYAYKRSIARVTEFVAKNRIAADDVKGIWSQVGKGQFSAFTGELGRVQDLLVKVQKAQGNLGRTQTLAVKSNDLANIQKQIDYDKQHTFALQANAKYDDVMLKTQSRAQAMNAAMIATDKARSVDLEKQYAQALKLNSIYDSTLAKTKDKNAALAAVSSGADKQFYNLQRNLTATEKRTQDFTLTWQNMQRILTIQLAHQALTSMINALQIGIQTAIDFQIQISRIRTINQEAQLSNETFAKSLRGISDAWGIDLMDEATAAYKAVSNQIAKGPELFTFMAEAAKFATVTVSTSTDAVNLLSGAMKAYGLDVSQTKNVSALLFKTIEIGRVEASELANTFGRIAVPASQLGISMAELGTAISVITEKGVGAHEAITQIRGVILELLKPSRDMKKAFGEILGVDSAEAAIKIYGLGGTLQRLARATEGSSTELATMFNNVRALTGVMGLTGASAERYNEVLSKITEGMQSYDKATEIAMESSGKNVQVTVNKIKNMFTELGSGLVDKISKIINIFGDLDNTIKVLASLMTGVLSAAIVAVTGLLLKLALVNPFGLAVTKIMLFATAVEYLTTVTRRELERINAAVKANSDAFKQTAYTSIDKIASAEKKANDERVRLLLKGSTEVIAQYVKEYNTLEKVHDKLVKNLEKAITYTGNLIQKVIDGIDKSVADNEAATKKFADNIRDLRKNIESEQFEINIEDLLPEEKINAYKKRIDEMVTYSEKAAGLGLFEDAKDAAKEAADLGKTMMKLIAQAEKEDAKKNKQRPKVESDRVEFERKSALELNQLDEQIKHASLTGDLKYLDKRQTFYDKYNALIAKGKYIEAKKYKDKIDRLGDNDRDNQQAKLKELKDRRVELELEIQHRREEFEGKISDLQTKNLKNQTTNYTTYMQGLADRLAKVQEAADAKRKKVEDDLFAEKAKREIDLQDFLDAKKMVSDTPLSKILELPTSDARESSFKERQDAIKKLMSLEQQFKGKDKDKLINEQRYLDLLANEQKQFDVNQKTQALKDYNTELLKQKDTLNSLIDLQVKEKKAAVDNLATQRANFVELQQILSSLTFVSMSEFPSQEKDAVMKLKEDLKKLLEDKDTSVLPNIAKNAKLLTKTFGEAQNRSSDTLNRIQTQDLRAILGRNPNLQNMLQAVANQASDSVTLARDLNALEQQRVQANTKIQAAITLQKTESQVILSTQQQRVAIEEKINKLILERPMDLSSLTRPLGPDDFARGGYAQDSVHAVLSPGEFVMNRAATGKYYSQLLAMNSGIKGYARGGIVNNNSVGNVNVSLQASGSVQTDVVAIGKELRRAIRRGTLSLA